MTEWLHNEKTKRATHRARKHGGQTGLVANEATVKGHFEKTSDGDPKTHKSQHGRTNSELSESGLALEKLEQILSKSMQVTKDRDLWPTEANKDPDAPRRKSTPKRQSSKRLLKRGSTIHSSDTEYQEPDIDVPSAEVVLDNSKTLGYTGGTATSEVDLLNPKKRAVKENDAWSRFKYEIVRLTHTLRLKGWRRLPLEKSGEIDVERLSGALTNAVYVVSPPPNDLETPSTALDSVVSLGPRKPLA